jgi:hypothetical protein
VFVRVLDSAARLPDVVGPFQAFIDQFGPTLPPSTMTNVTKWPMEFMGDLSPKLPLRIGCSAGSTAASNHSAKPNSPRSS